MENSITLFFLHISQEYTFEGRYSSKKSSLARPPLRYTKLKPSLVNMAKPSSDSKTEEPQLQNARTLAKLNPPSTRSKGEPQWSRAEFKLLWKLKNEGYDFDYISKQINGRTSHQCRRKWARRKGALWYLRQIDTTIPESNWNKEDDSIRGSDWTKDEDTLCVSLKREKKRWKAISNRLPGRSPAACKIHWSQVLLPRLRNGYPDEDEEQDSDEDDRKDEEEDVGREETGREGTKDDERMDDGKVDADGDTDDGELDADADTDDGELDADANTDDGEVDADGDTDDGKVGADSDTDDGEVDADGDTVDEEWYHVMASYENV